MSIVLIILSQVVFHILEARHDYFVIAGADPNKVTENRAWHIEDAMCWFFVHLTLAYSCGNPLILFTGLFARLLFLGVALNSLRGLPYYYISLSGIDGFMRKTMGQVPSFWLRVLLFAGFSALAINNN